MKKIAIISIFITVLLSGCESFLDKTDPTATTFQEFFIDEDDLRRVAYSSFYDVFTNHGDRKLLFYMMDGRSDNAYARSEDDHHLRIGNGNINSNTRAFEYYYTIYMKHIGRLNTYIANIDVPYVEDESIRTRYENILKGLRIWHYFRLTFHWGDVPFLLEPAELEDATLPATPKKEILDTLFRWPWI